MKQITLLGAAGVIGKSIADALRKTETPYRVVGRHRESLQQAFGGDPRAEIVTWNPDDPASIRGALAGTETLIYLVGVAYNQFELHPVLMRKTVDAAVAENVPQCLLVTSFYPYGLPQTTPITESHPREPNTYKGRKRKEQEDVLLEAEAAGRIRACIIRLADFYGPDVEASYLHGLFQAAATGGTANMLGPIDTLHDFLFVPDAGPVITALAAHPGAWGHAWHMAGSGPATQRELAERVFAMAGRKPRIRVAGKTMVRIAGLFSPLMRALVEMHYLLTNPVLMDDTALWTLLGGWHRTSYEEGLRLSLEAAQARAAGSRR